MSKSSFLWFSLELSQSISAKKYLDKAVIDIGLGREMVAGLIFVAISHVRQEEDLAFVQTYPYSRLAAIKKGACLFEHRLEEERFDLLQ